MTLGEDVFIVDFFPLALFALPFDFIPFFSLFSFFLIFFLFDFVVEAVDVMKEDSSSIIEDVAGGRKSEVNMRSVSGFPSSWVLLVKKKESSSSSKVIIPFLAFDPFFFT